MLSSNSGKILTTGFPCPGDKDKATLTQLAPDPLHFHPGSQSMNCFSQHEIYVECYTGLQSNCLRKCMHFLPFYCLLFRVVENSTRICFKDIYIPNQRNFMYTHLTQIFKKSLTNQKPNYFSHPLLLSRMYTSRKLDRESALGIEHRHSAIRHGHPNI